MGDVSSLGVSTKNLPSVAYSPDQLRARFLEGYTRTFGGGTSPNTVGGLNNAAFRNSLSGYYGGQNFNDIAKQLSFLNTFQKSAGFPFRASAFPVASPGNQQYPNSGGSFNLF